MAVGPGSMTTFQDVQHEEAIKAMTSDDWCRLFSLTYGIDIMYPTFTGIHTRVTKDNLWWVMEMFKKHGDVGIMACRYYIQKIIPMRPFNTEGLSEEEVVKMNERKEKYYEAHKTTTPTDVYNLDKVADAYEEIEKINPPGKYSLEKNGEQNNLVISTMTTDEWIKFLSPSRDIKLVLTPHDFSYHIRKRDVACIDLINPYDLWLILPIFRKYGAVGISACMTYKSFAWQSKFEEAYAEIKQINPNI